MTRVGFRRANVRLKKGHGTLSVAGVKLTSHHGSMAAVCHLQTKAFERKPLDKSIRPLPQRDSSKLD